METIANNLNNQLKALFDIDDDIYKILFSNPNGTIATEILKPTDIDIGADASIIEYLRRLSICLVKQLFLDEADSSFIDYIAEKYFNTLRFKSETNEDLINRIIAKVFRHKVSKAALIVALRPYSSQEPEIENVLSDAMFASYSFASRYKSFRATYNGGEKKVYPAIARSFSFSLYTIKIILYDTSSSQISTVNNVVKEVKASGITYELVIRTT